MRKKASILPVLRLLRLLEGLFPLLEGLVLLLEGLVLLLEAFVLLLEALVLPLEGLVLLLEGFDLQERLGRFVNTLELLEDYRRHELAPAAPGET